jgi:hypothetical protein
VNRRTAQVAIVCRSETHRYCSEAVWRGTTVCWNPVRVIASLEYQVARKRPAVPAVLLRRDVAKDGELLVPRHENAVLRRQLTKPVRYEPADRLWFAALSSLIPRRQWAQVFPVAPTTAAGVAPQAARPEVGLQQAPEQARPTFDRACGEGSGAAARQGESSLGLPTDPRGTLCLPKMSSMQLRSVFDGAAG